MAFPNEGNYARYLASFNGETYEYKKMLTHFNPQKNTFVQITKLSKGDEIIRESSNELAYMWFYNEAKVQNVLDTCVRREGALGDYVVQEQTIKSCAFYSEDSGLEYVIGMVPFGQLRFQIYLQNEDFLDFYLVNFY